MSAFEIEFKKQQQQLVFLFTLSMDGVGEGKDEGFDMR